MGGAPYRAVSSLSGEFAYAHKPLLPPPPKLAKLPPSPNTDLGSSPHGIALQHHPRPYPGLVSLDKARSGKSTLVWEQIARLQETPDFYLVASADMVRQGVACLIAKHCDLMPAEEYQQGLQAFLSQCPVTPSAN
ncbi:hypothetical protein PSWA111526_17470 [Pseudomonas wadenswilerensis]|uniref:Uncharacterized protein n=1 Tax=Pseudomonas wadenswilerensis TaxID=1785161 RepID=A0A380T7I7_9PSED|nr:hypothetical protein CCOS864_05453 [Pseudomonas wadenswilerensis]